jgi:hypothetical protein
MRKMAVRMSAMRARPPTTPPTMAPMGVDFFWGVGAGDPLALEAEVGVGVELEDSSTVPTGVR